MIEPKEPNFIAKIEALQFLLCGIVGTIILVVWITSFDFIINIFKPNFLIVLSILRVGLTSLGLVISSLVGIKAALWLLEKALELKQNYKKLLEEKEMFEQKSKEGDKDE